MADGIVIDCSFGAGGAKVYGVMAQNIHSRIIMRNTILLSLCALSLLAACGKPKAADSAPVAAAAASEPVAAAPDSAPSVDVSATIAGVYKTDPKHAYINFSYDHFGYSRPLLRWRSWTADLNWNPESPAQSSLDVAIDANSVDSGVDIFDDHLKSADFFDTANHPDITFKSTSVAVTGGATGTVTGDLTIKGVSKPVTLDVRVNRAADDSFAKGYKLGFSASGVVKRSDFGVDKYAPMVSDDVAISIEAEFVLPKETAPAQ